MSVEVQERNLPAGTVTFLFTDIEGSTRLLKQLNESYTFLLADQRDILRTAFEKWDGREIDTQGDAFFASFPRATQAVAAVVEIQRALAAHDWPEGAEVRVRMGLHTGEPWLVEEGYVGMDVHRAARIAHIGHGGQVLLSETTGPLVRDELPEGVKLLDLGSHRLKDLRRPEHIHQLVIDGLPSEFPPLNSLEVVSAPGLPEEVAARPPREVGLSPYRGLAAFQEEDAQFFFGREAFSAQLAEAVQHHSLVAVVVGSSGSGKSSAVFAGLLPQLREDDNWLILQLRPGGSPFQSLSRSLVSLLDDELGETERLVEAQRLSGALQSGEVSLYQVVERVLERHPPASRALIVIDQFEELFTLNRDPDLQTAFLDELLATAQAGEVHHTSPVAFLFTLRADFMGQALTHRPFADALQAGSLMLGPMNRDELRAAIEKPAELQGASFEAGLVSRILDDVGQEPGNLPLLEFALTLLWDQMEGGWMTHEVYDLIGRVEGALARYAGEIYNKLSTGEQEGTRRAFVQLVQPGQGTEDTRRVARRADMVGVDWGLLQHLADKRLVVTGMDETGVETVEVVHEALIRGWGRLRKWMAADRDFRNWQEGLRVALRGWENSGQDSGALLRGVPLAQAEEWLGVRSNQIGDEEKEYIQASLAYKQQREAQRERRRRLIIGGLAAGFVVTLLLSIFAFSQRSTAEQNAQRANQNAATAEAESLARATQQALAEAARIRAEDEGLARATQQAIAEEQHQLALVQASIGLASQSQLEQSGRNPERAVSMALEAVEKYPYTWQAERALGKAVFGNHLYQILQHDTVVNRATWSPDGSRILTASNDDTARVWDASTGQLIHTLEHDDDVAFALWSPTGDRILSVGYDLQNIIWDANSGEKLVTLEGHEAMLGGAGWNARGDRIITTSEDTTARIWDATTGEELALFSGHEAAVFTCLWRGCALGISAWSPAGDRVVTADQAGEIYIWDPESGEQMLHLTGHDDWINSITWSPEGDRIASASDDGTARVWDANTGEQLASYGGHGGVINAIWSPLGDQLALTFNFENVVVIMDATSGEKTATFEGHGQIPWHAVWHLDGSKILTGGGDENALIWDPSTGSMIQAFRGHAADVFYGDWSPLGDQILTASDDGTAKVWNIASQTKVLEIPGDDVGGWAYDWSPSGDRILRSYDGGILKVFDAATGEQQLFIDAHTVLIDRAQFSPSGNELLSIARNGEVRVWDAEAGENLVDSAYDEGFWTADWSPDGTRFVTGSWDSAVKIWDAGTGEELLTLSGHRGAIPGLSWSPDGLHILSTSEVGEAKIWDATTGELQLDLYPKDNDLFVAGVSWSPDSSSVTTYSTDGVLSIWDARTGEELQSMVGHGAVVWRISWFPGGERLLAADSNNEIKIWEATTGAEVASFTVPDSNGAWLSPDGRQILVAVIGGPLIIYDIWGSLDELTELARDCCIIRQLSSEERQQFGLPPLEEVE